MDWTQFQIAHFATHAILSTTHPAFSGVVLSLVRSDGTPQKGVLWLDDIYNLTMPVDLVVLSGCRTAEGRDVPGEGLEGLSRAFLIAGASGVIGSLWSVEDQRTSLLMEKFYRGLLARHMSVAAALRNAQRSLAHSQKTAAPYYWAGFSIQGAPPRPR